MKHPNFITLDDATVEYSEVKPMIEALAKRLSEAGISVTVSRRLGPEGNREGPSEGWQ